MRILLFTLVSLLTIGAAQEKDRERPSKPPAPNRMAAFLPFAPGAEWTWDFTVDDKAPVVRKWRCVRQVTAGPNRTRCWELRTLLGKYSSWTYWSVRDDGIYKHANRSLGPMRGVSGRKPTRLVPGPFGVSTKWKWTEIGSVQTEGGSSYPSKDELRKNFEGSIVAMSEEVTVPAGTFTAARVKIVMTSAMFGNSEETLWFARGTGIVKQRIVNATHSTTHLFELRRYVPGADPTETPRQRIDKLLASETFRSRPRPRIIVPVRHKTVTARLGSEFFLARIGDGMVMFRDFEGKASVFHPREVDSWNRLFAEEFGESRGRYTAHLTQAFGVLAAIYDNPRANPTTHGIESIGENGRRAVRVKLTTSDSTGRRVSSWAKMWFDKDKLTELQLR